MFQVCNLGNHIYTGDVYPTISLPDDIVVLDYDDLIIEIVKTSACINQIQSDLVAISPIDFYNVNYYLPYLDTQCYNNFIRWQLCKKNEVELVLGGEGHRLALNLYVSMTGDFFDREVRCKLVYDSVRLFGFNYHSECELHINYAFRHNEFIILRLSICDDTQQQVFNLSLVFRHRTLLGCYITHAFDEYHIVKPISKGLESKLKFFLQDKY